MQKKILIILALGLILGGCAASSIQEEIQPDMSAQQFIDGIYKIFQPELGLAEMEVDKSDPESIKYFTGLDSLDKIKDLAVSEPMIGSQAYSLVLLRAEDSKDSKDLAKEIKEGIDPRKWICVGADNVSVVTRGDLIMLVMVDSNLKDVVSSKDLVQAFEKMAGGLDFELN